MFFVSVVSLFPQRAVYPLEGAILPVKQRFRGTEQRIPSQGKVFEIRSIAQFKEGLLAEIFRFPRWREPSDVTVEFLVVTFEEFKNHRLHWWFRSLIHATDFEPMVAASCPRSAIVDEGLGMSCDVDSIDSVIRGSGGSQKPLSELLGTCCAL